MAAERAPFRKGWKRREEMESPGGERGFEIVQEQASKQARQNPDGKEETRPASHPSIAFGRDAATGNQAVQVRVMEQILAPRVQHTYEADLGAQMGRIGGDGAQRLRGGPEQDVVDYRFVLVGNDGDLVGKREDRVEVRRLQKLGLSLRQPFGAGKRLAFWAMPIATGIEATRSCSQLSHRCMAAQRRGAAQFDCAMAHRCAADSEASWAWR